MIDDDVVQVPVDLSLTRRVLLWGADRRVAGWTILLAIAMVFGVGLSTLSITTAAFLLLVVLPVSTLVERWQPGFWTIVPRYLTQQVFYPARAAQGARRPRRLKTRMR